MFSRRMLSVLGLSLLVCAATVASPVKGTFTANGQTVNLSYAYASTRKNPFDEKKTDTFLIVTDKELPAGTVFDDFALIDLADKGISGFTVQFSGDKQVDSGTLFSPAFKAMHQFSSVGKQKLTLTTQAKDRVAGTVSMPAGDFFDENYAYTATFDVPVQAKPAEKTAAQKVAELKGAKLPADGGEPGKAWQAYRKAITAGDLASIRKSVVAEMAKQTEDPDFKKMLPVIQAMQPKNVKIDGGTIDGDNATLLVTSLDEKNTTGTVTMRRESGQWKVVNESWKSRTE